MAAQEYENGSSRTSPSSYLSEIIGKVRAGWIVGVIIISAVTNFTATLIINGWVIAPAKSTELAAAVEILRANKAQLAELGPSVIRLDESFKGVTRQLDSIDRKIDVLLRQPAVRAQVIVKPKGFFGN
jgi:hypothetical protein